MPWRLALLDDVSVAEVGDTVAVAVAGAALASFGATVTSGAGPTVGGEGLPRLAGGETSYLRAYLDQHKETPADQRQLLEAIATADIILCDRAGQLPAALQSPDVAGYRDLVARLNPAAWVSISPFGLSGPYADRLSGDLCDLAAGGALWYTRTEPGGRPTKLAGQQGQMLIGEVAAVAALHGLDRWRTTGEPVHVDLSAQEVIVATGPFLECARLLWNCGDAELKNFGTPQGPIPCRDGDVLLYVIEDRHWDGLLEAMGHPSWADPYRDKQRRRSDERFVIERISDWSRTLDKVECANRLQRVGVPASPIHRPSEALQSEQFAVRGFVTRSDSSPWPAQVTLGLPVVIEEAPGQTASRSHALTGLKVLDATHVLGPPLASAWLGSMGAHVVKVEDASRVELYRRFGPFADGEAGVDRSAFFAASNFGKSGVTLDLSTEEGKAALSTMVDWADVVIENQTARHAAELGFDDVPSHGALHVCSSGYGRTGPLRDHRAYGQNLMAYSGVTELSRDRRGAIVAIGTPWADVVTGVFLATALAAYGISRHRDIARVDVSMAEVVARHVAEYLLAEGAADSDQNDSENDRFPCVPHGVYPCADGGWLALSVVDDDEWAALLDALPHDAGLATLDLKTAQERYERRRDLDELVGTALLVASASHWFDQLQSVGVRAVPVWSAADLIEDPHLLARDFFVEQEHSSAGRRRVAGLPWRFAGKPPLVPAAAPRFGDMKGRLLV